MNKNQLKIVTWNVNGIRSRIFNNKTSAQLPKNKKFYSEENSSISNLIKTTDADIICLQETRCSEEIGKLAILNDYYSYFNNSKLTEARGLNRYSGTAIYSKIIPNKIEHQIPGYNDLEGRIIILHYDKFIIINVYVPNSGTNYENRIKFNNAFLEYFKTIDIPTIFCGDMNMAVDTYFDKTKVKPMPGIYKHELEFYKQIIKEAFKDTIDYTEDNIVYTWWNPLSKKVLNEETNLMIGNQRKNNNGWRLDYIFIRGFSDGKSKVLKNIGEENDPQCSDHAPVFGILNI